LGGEKQEPKQMAVAVPVTTNCDLSNSKLETALGPRCL